MTSKADAPPTSKASEPSSPTFRRLSFGSIGGGNDGSGGQIYKVCPTHSLPSGVKLSVQGLQKKRTNSLDKQAAFADQSKSPVCSPFTCALTW